jgi:hypothetical protein
LVQNKTQDHPQISGVFNMDDDDYWTIDTVLSATSLEYFKSYSSIFKDSTIESIAFRVKFKTNDHVIHFKGSLKLNQLVLANKILAKEALDPISPLIQLHGIWNYQDKKIDVVNSHMLLQTDEDPPKQIRFKFETRTDFNSSIYGNWQGTLSLPKTSCQDFFDQIPPNFIPNIKAFSWSGHLSFALPLELNTSGPEHLAMDFSNFDFSCETQNTPIEFTAEHLKSPFIIERKQTDSGDYVKIPLNFPQVHLPLGAVHPYFRRALIASEDIKFWTHPGIDWEAIKNATDLNLHEKRVVLGGSTITMQTAKNLYLNFDRNLSRKFEEILIAWHLEKIFTKKQILETYINIVEFGPNIFGLKNAAKHFFDKSPENLNLLESVYLGSILPSPIKRYRHFCEGRISQGFQQDLNEKIGKLVNFNFIDQWEGEKASKMTLTFHRPEGIEDSTLCQRSLALSSSR